MFLRCIMLLKFFVLYSCAVNVETLVKVRLVLE